MKQAESYVNSSAQQLTRKCATPVAVIISNIRITHAYHRGLPEGQNEWTRAAGTGSGTPQALSERQLFIPEQEALIAQ